MVKLDKNELLKIAELSALKLNENELELFAQQLQTILNYTKELDQVKLTENVTFTKNVNFFRKDIAKQQDSKPLLEQAPKRKNGYFVVPKILN
jgi:aspartyl-tRNA(Asn)/glutamyl-tRNA(Gln) amidotransferase subunit C